ncbi:phytoene desaturase family protein [Alkalihalobacterium chitinilyticum]|uniref:Phytoene desaturase family protein n=1 Tax=Alkalihalobacterium chitinilyticum TaxID=2980103 RepID=A0ABT5V9E7_9BACI|nr:phytoene desaturase family protein [Alkalihalobacterium chitinilyticum]MDE5412083.1 phytoene desaturase family protein [Alkalihalobacterium chitinilyticum]
MARKHIVVVGAGPGGLAAAMLLVSQGYKVTVFEKQPYVGGRTSSFQLDDYTFDLGPTFLSMPHILEELFEAAGKKLEDYLSLVELDPMYELRFSDVIFSPSRNVPETRKKIEELFPGNGEGYERFMKHSDKKLDALMPLLQNRHSSLLDYFRLRTLRALPQLSLGRSLYDVLGDFFTDEKLKLAFTFQSKYLGMSPWECPGAFSILSYMEHKYGVFHPLGGLNQIPKAMAKVIKEYGGEVVTGVGVKKLLTKDREITGVLLEDGEKVHCDDVIVNADFAHAMTHLLDDGLLKSYSKQQLKKKDYSCSTFMLYLGVNKEFKLPHHTIVFADDYKKNVEEITKTKVLSDNPSIYIQNACVTDPTLAPEGKSALYILAPVPNNTSLIEWEKHQSEFRQLVLEQIESRTEFKGLQENIEVEKMITPLQWEKDLFVYEGATFNLSHRLKQMMYFRPHNKFQELKNCWLVGGGTHPGSGLPTIFESARITANSILQENKTMTVHPTFEERTGMRGAQ